MTKIIPRSWITSRAKRIERKCLEKFGRSLSFTAIELILTSNAIIEYQIDTKNILLDIDKFKENENNYLKEVNLKTN